MSPATSTVHSDAVQADRRQDLCPRLAREQSDAILLGVGEPACFAATVLDGLVLARSPFEHGPNYKSVVAFGRFHEITGDEDRLGALMTFTSRLLPGRWCEVRPPNVFWRWELTTAWAA